MWSGSIWPRQRTRSCSVWMRSHQIQALDRTQKMLPMRPGRPGRRTHDYRRHGTTTLVCGVGDRDRHRDGGVQASTSPPGVPGLCEAGRLGLPRPGVASGDGQLCSAQTGRGRDWLAANPRITVHFTPTSGSWLNLVEVWFGIIERQAIHRSTFASVKDLNAKIRVFITGWNNRCHPFVWTKPADDILKRANRQQTSNTAH